MNRFPHDDRPEPDPTTPAGRAIGAAEEVWWLLEGAKRLLALADTLGGGGGGLLESATQSIESAQDAVADYACRLDPG